MNKAVKTPEGIIKFANLEEPYQFNKNSVPKYTITICFPEDADLSEMKAEVDERLEQFPPGTDPLSCLYFDGDEQGFPHSVYLKASNKDRPAITMHDIDLRQESLRTIEGSYARFCPGATVRAKIRFSAYSSGNNKGVNAYLDGLLLVKDADPAEPKVLDLAEWGD